MNPWKKSYSLNTGAFKQGKLKLHPAFDSALFTVVTLLAIVSMAHAKPRPPMPPLPQQQLASWRFDGADPAPLASFNLQTAESWSGYALEMSGTKARLIALREMSTEGRVALNRTEGTLQFWFRPAWSSAKFAGSGPGQEGRLLEVGAWSAKTAVGWWALSVDAKGDSIRFLAQSQDKTLEVLEAPVAWCAGEWHHIALAWSAKETLLYVDGQIAASGPGVTLEPLSKFTGTTGFCLGGDVDGRRLAQGQFEELQSFGRVRTGAELAGYYQGTAPLAALGPVTAKEEEAFRAAAALAAAEKLAGRSGVVQTAMSDADYGCSLWLGIVPAANAVTLTLHNTIPGRMYQILSKESLSLSTWSAEETVVGTTAQDKTVTTVQMNGRPKLFLHAVELGEYFVDRSFKGLDFFDTGISPADTMDAVGIEHFVELLNATVAVFDKASGEQLEIRSIQDFFAIPGTSYPLGEMFDPRILYDHEAQRWVACATDKESEHVILAVSQTSSPLGLLTGWTKHLVPVARAGSDSDFTTLGADANGVYVSVFQYHHGNGGIVYDGHAVAAIKKPQIYDGTLQQTVLFVDSPDLTSTAIQPAVNFDNPPSGGYAWFVAKGSPQVSPTYKPGAVYYRRLQWNGSAAAWADTTWRLLSEPTPSYRDFYDLDSGDYYGLNLGDVSAPQAGGTQGKSLKGVGSRLMTATIRDGFLWTCQQVGLDGTDGDYDGDQTGATVDRTAAQWMKLQINSSGEPLTHSAHGRIYDDCETDPYYYYFPSLMVNSRGDMVAGFSASKTTEYIGAFFSWRLANGIALDRPALIRNGLGYTEHQWGDYSQTCLDPTDGLALWTVQQYAESGKPWGTVAAKIRPKP